MSTRESSPLTILVSAYACGPNWGSEIGMGWNWVIALSDYCQLHVITELDFKKDIEATIPNLNLKFTPIFYYIDVTAKGRDLFWKQGSFTFYNYYRIWQKKALEFANEILGKEKIDIVHQLNMIGFREPGYLWKIKNMPYIWGPVGGYNQFPWSYMTMLSFRNFAYYAIKNTVNMLQILFLSRPKNAAKRANAVFAATLESKKEIDKISKIKSIVLNETGCNPNTTEVKPKYSNSCLEILWVGKIQGLKALPLALQSLSKVSNVLDFRLTVVGDGPDESDCKQMAQDLKIEQKCLWKGKIPHSQVEELMRSSDLLFFTSVKEGTPHVVTEAIENGLPVICHNACGHGAVITDECGIKVPMVNPKTSVEEFSKVLLQIKGNPSLLNKLSVGARKRANELTWKSKAIFMVETYNKLKTENASIS